MFATLIIMTLLVGFFLGIAAVGGVFALLVRKEEAKKNPYTDAIDRGKKLAADQMPVPGPILS